jgi:small-conductance mechanosensitive channel
VLKERIRVPLLRDVIARGTGILVLLLGLYLVLRICGLTRLALTVLGGTGLFGLVLGIAFRDITENFLASILLSVQAPFRNGDLIEIAGATGFVQQLNVRTTVLMSPAGHYVQLPNSVVYKSTIRNYSTNPNRREDFTIGIGYEVPIVRAQEIALAVLDEHPGVLKTPEPWVLVDSLGSATVNLRIYFWIDGSQLSWLKVRSSIIRLVKRAFQDQGVTIPDEVREVIFPRGVPVQMVEAPKPSPPDANTASSASAPPDEAASVAAEGGLGTEARQIEEQASQAPASDASHDLLRPS